MDAPTLPELVRTALDEQGLSVRAAAARAGVHHAALSRIASGEVVRANESTLLTIHRALRIPMKQLEDANAGHTRFRLPERADQLTNAERALIVDLIDALLRARGRGQ